MSRTLVSFSRRLLFHTIDPFILGLFRVALGAFLTLFYVAQARDWQEFYGPAGWAPTRAGTPGERHLLEPVLVYIDSEAGMWAFFTVCLVASVLLALGLFGKIPLVWLWVSNYSLMYRNLGTTNAEEQVLAVLMLFGLFLPLNAALTVRRARGGNETRVRVWALRPLQVYIVAIYLFALPWKIRLEPAWFDGTLVYYATSELVYSRWPSLGAVFAWGGGVLSHVCSFYTLAVETLFPFAVWFRPLRSYAVACMMVLHLAIGVLLEGVTYFNLAMCVALLLFLPSRTTRRRTAEARAWLLGKASAAEASTPTLSNSSLLL